MRRIELQDLVRLATPGSQSTADVVREMTAVTIPDAPTINLEAPIITSPSSSADARIDPTAASVERNPLEDSASSVLQVPLKDVSEQLSALSAHITTLSTTQQTQIGATQDNTQAVTQNTASKGASGSSVASQVGGLASSFFGGALSFAPIIGGLVKLFGGGDKAQAATVPSPFQLPASVQYEAGLTGGSATQIVPVDYGQRGQTRAAQSTTQAITIQVNAMDSRSFLDHSEEIASAVKQAMLNSNSLNDVISDL